MDTYLLKPIIPSSKNRYCCFSKNYRDSEESVLRVNAFRARFSIIRAIGAVKGKKFDFAYNVSQRLPEEVWHGVQFHSVLEPAAIPYLEHLENTFFLQNFIISAAVTTIFPHEYQVAVVSWPVSSMSVICSF